MKGLRLATRCRSLEQFVDVFHRFVDERTIFISSLASLPMGYQTTFRIDLVGGKPVLRGKGEVLGIYATTKNRFGRPGVRLQISELTADASRVFEMLMVARQRAAEKLRTPRADIVLPANPLADITDRTLDGLLAGALAK